MKMLFVEMFHEKSSNVNYEERCVVILFADEVVTNGVYLWVDASNWKTPEWQ